MKSLILLVGALLIAACAGKSARAQFWSGSYYLLGGPQFPAFIQNIDPAPSIDITKNMNDTEIGDNGIYHIGGSGQVGIHTGNKTFGISALASTYAESGAWGFNRFGVHVNTQIDGSETLKMIARPTHKNLIAYSFWHVSGTLVADGVGKYSASIPAVSADYVDYSAESELEISGTGIVSGLGYDGDVYAHLSKSIYSEATVDTPPINQPLLTDAIPVALTLVNGVVQPFKFDVTVFASVYVKDFFPTSNAGVGAPGSAYALADFGHTFSWGGITSVVDADTGEAIDDWTLTSGSGTDWSTAAVPEPSCLVSVLSGVILLKLRRKRRATCCH